MILYEYIERLNKWLESTTFNDSSTITTEKTDAGWKFHVRDMPTVNNGSGATTTPDVYPCVTSGAGNTQDGYPVTIYANGFDKAATGYGVLHVLDLALSDNGS